MVNNSTGVLEKIDLITGLIDEFLLSGRTGVINDLCFDNLPDVDTTLTVLTATLAAKSKLPRRREYLERAKKKFGTELFKGLE